MDVTVPAEAAGERLDVFLARHAGSRAAAQKLIDAGLVAVDGAPRPKRHVLAGGERVEVGTAGSLEEILFGPGHRADGTLNLVGALQRALATTGYSDLKEFQRVEVVTSSG